MREQGVIVKASSAQTIAEEMPDAYKDVDLVVDATEQAGLGR
jgi:tRNA-splicing ligase RtcB